MKWQNRDIPALWSELMVHKYILLSKPGPLTIYMKLWVAHVHTVRMFFAVFFNWIRNWRHQAIISISNGLDLWRHMMWIVSIIIHWPHTDAFVSRLTILTRYHRLYNTVLSTQIHSTVNKGPTNRISLARWIRWLLNLCLEKAVTGEHWYIAQESVKTSRLILTLYRVFFSRVFAIFIIPSNWHDAECWNPS